ncbi:hypothetical protein [Alloprevotella tannerae]|uniref:hypothetical protein n=1 Tax=Alloprevotella tannerae TaxID=76122 RepID=UPI0028E205D3|nr:hypothetical protein [Alloprevotella tannerae]
MPHRDKRRQRPPRPAARRETYDAKRRATHYILYISRRRCLTTTAPCESGRPEKVGAAAGFTGKMRAMPRRQKAALKWQEAADDKQA